MSLLLALITTAIFVPASWFLVLFLCSFTFVQRQVFYAHNAPISRGQQLDKPETFGFLPNQVAPLFIPTSNNDRLFAWLIAPLKVYLNHEYAFVSGQTLQGTQDIVLKLIAADEKAHLVIYFHGNAGTVGQTRRTEAYRSITTGDPDHTYVLTFDYRGFGRSSGTPTEINLTADSINVIAWAMQMTKLPPKNILLLSQSLGTALATAVVEYYANRTPAIEFGGLIICAAFTSAVDIFAQYSLFGLVPVLGPLQHLPYLNAWFARQITDTWNTQSKLQSIVARTKRLHLTMIHATGDEVVPYKMLGRLTEAMLIILNSRGIESETTTKLSHGGEATEWRSGCQVIRSVTLIYGGHNTIMKWSPVGLEVARILKEGYGG